GKTRSNCRTASTNASPGPAGSRASLQSCRRSTYTSPDFRSQSMAALAKDKPIDEAALKKRAAIIRGRVIEMCHASGSAHLGSCLSCIDVLTAAYWHVLKIDPKNPTDPLRDRF